MMVKIMLDTAQNAIDAQGNKNAREFVAKKAARKMSDHINNSWMLNRSDALAGDMSTSLLNASLSH